MDINNLTMGNAVLLSVGGFLIVFMVLCMIALFLTISARVLGTKGKKSDAATAKSAPVSAGPVKSAPAPIATAQDDTDLVLIAAAVAAYLGTSPSNLVIRSVRKVDSAWVTSSRINNISRSL